MRCLKSVLYVLEIDRKIVCISETPQYVSKYILEFAEYFKNHSSYLIREVRRNDLEYNDLESYHRLHLHEWVNGIILTDREITFMDKVFREIYENEKIMITQSILNCKIMNLSDLDKMRITEITDDMYKKLGTFDDFISNVRVDAILEKYIVSPEVVDMYMGNYKLYKEEVIEEEYI